MIPILSLRTVRSIRPSAPPVTDVSARLRAEAEAILGDVALVLHLTQRLKAELRRTPLDRVHR